MRSDDPSCNWYKRLTNHHSKFTPLYGVDDTGDVYKPENLADVADYIQKKHAEINLAVADGGFKVQKDTKGNHIEQLQEVYSARIVFSQTLLMMKTLQPNGHFVCKLFDSYSNVTTSTIYLVSLLFKKCYIVKPFRSRAVNSER